MRPFHLVRAAAAALLLAGCSDDPLAPFQPEIHNSADSFEFQVTAMTGVNTTAEYRWQHTGTVANVNQATALTGGSATLTVLDAAGTQVYTRTLADNGTYQTAAGTPGEWRVRVTLTTASGAANFRLQKRTP